MLHLLLDWSLQQQPLSLLTLLATLLLTTSAPLPVAEEEAGAREHVALALAISPELVVGGIARTVVVASIDTVATVEASADTIVGV